MVYQTPRKRPESEREFELEMEYVDKHLHDSGLIPAQRPHVFPLRFHDAFRESTHVYPDDALADEEGFQGDILIAKGHRWYQEVYGNRLNHLFELGFAVVKLGNALWRFSVPQVFGGPCEYVIDKNIRWFGTDCEGNSLCKGSMVYDLGVPVQNIKINILACVDELPQGMASRLSDEQLSEFFQWFYTTITGLSWFVNLFWRVDYGDDRLFYMAHRDCQSSCANLLQGRYPQSRWDSTQSAEKLLKGILKVLTGEYPRIHDLEAIYQKVAPMLGAEVGKSLLRDIQWETGGRYAEIPAELAETFKANQAVFILASHLATDKTLNGKLTDARKSVGK